MHHRCESNCQKLHTTAVQLLEVGSSRQSVGGAVLSAQMSFHQCVRRGHRNGRGSWYTVAFGRCFHLIWFVRSTNTRDVVVSPHTHTLCCCCLPPYHRSSPLEWKKQVAATFKSHGIQTSPFIHSGLFPLLFGSLTMWGGNFSAFLHRCYF